MEFYEHLKTYLSDEEISLLRDSLQDEQKYGLLLNEKKLTKEQFLSLYPNVKPHPIVPNGFIYDKNEYEFGKNIFYEMGVYYLQEPSAMIVSYLLNPSENDVVLDLCAAPGGKTCQASLLMNGKGTLYSNDLSHQRCQALLENVERMGLSNVIITNNDYSKIYKNYLNYFDKIILDAPCSGSGMFRKDSKMMDDWSYAKVLKFAEIQKELIQIAFAMLKPGGEMIYSTCSLSLEEDENVIDYLVNNNENVELVPLKNDIFYTNKNHPIGVHLLSFKFNGEGHYICKIKKKIDQNHPISQINCKKFTPNKVSYGDYTFIMPNPCKTDGLNIIRYGVKAIEKKGKDQIYCHHMSHSIINENCPTYACELSYTSACEYLKGQTLNINAPKGLVLLTYLHIPLGYGKSDGRIIKNHYPKYLRNRRFM